MGDNNTTHRRICVACLVEEKSVSRFQLPFSFVRDWMMLRSRERRVSQRSERAIFLNRTYSWSGRVTQVFENHEEPSKKEDVGAHTAGWSTKQNTLRPVVRPCAVLSRLPVTDAANSVI